MARKLIVSFSLVVMALALTGASYASLIQITLGPSSSGSITVSPSSAIFSGVTGTANQVGGLGQGTFGILSANIPVTGTNGPTYLLAPNSSAVTVSIGSDTMSGNFLLAGFQSGTFRSTTVSTFIGYFVVTSATSGFASTGFPVGSTSLADFVTVASPYYNGLSSGELVPTPEPATFALVGSGLLAAAGLLRRKL
jgi:hypothetical protein